MEASDIRNLRELEDENRRLKQMYAEILTRFFCPGNSVSLASSRTSRRLMPPFNEPIWLTITLSSTRVVSAHSRSSTALSPLAPRNWLLRLSTPCPRCSACSLFTRVVSNFTSLSRVCSSELISAARSSFKRASGNNSLPETGPVPARCGGRFS